MRRTTAILVALIAASLAAPQLADAQSRKRKRRQKRPPAEQPTPPRGDTPATEPEARRGDRDGRDGRRGGKTQVLDFTGLELGGQLRTPQLLYFLDRVDEELERAALEKRSFIPAMTRSIEEGPL